jgi:hopanoid biosynthesis associated protein HpnK
VTAGVIINADDFGLSPGVSRGIVDAFREGVLTSATMLVNLEFFADAVRLARENGDLPLGIHLSLLWGRPVSDPREVPSLVRGDGTFPDDLGTLARRYYSGRLAARDVRLEFGNQIRAFLAAGLVPTHLDTHKHVHCLPGVLEALIDSAREFGIDKVRVPREEPLLRRTRGLPALPWSARCKRRLVHWLCRGARARLHRAGLRSTDHFVGIEATGRLNSGLLDLILSTLRSGVTEIMCHPGYDDEPARRYSTRPPQREVELEALKDPAVKARVTSGTLRLMNYGDL